MHTMTNGASQDIQEATNIARNMVAMFGMSDEFGMMALGSIRNQYLDGGYGLDCAQETAAIMDKEVKVILDQCYKDAVALIQDNLEDMHKVVAYLLEKETITGGEMVAIIEGRDPALVEDAYASTRQSEKKKPLPGDIEPPAKNIHIVSEEIKPPVPLGDGEEHAPDGSQPEDGQPAAEELRSSRTRDSRSRTLRRRTHPRQRRTPPDRRTVSPPTRTRVKNKRIKNRAVELF